MADGAELHEYPAADCLQRGIVVKTVAINEYISLHGVSGSSRATTSLKSALAKNFDVRSVRPGSVPKGGLLKAGHMAAWDFKWAAKQASSLGADVLVNSANTGRAANGMASVLVLYDTMVLDHPAWFDPRFVRYAQFTYGPSAQGADVIVTCSDHSADRIASRWPTKHVEVVRLPSFARQSVDAAAWLRPRQRPYFLIVGSFDRHKRTDLGIRAVQRFREIAGRDHDLVIVGRKGNASSDVSDLISQVNKRVEWVFEASGITDEELSQLYLHAVGLVVASKDEGYCLPALEATAHGTAVVHLNRGALPELAPRPEIGTPKSYGDEIDALVDQMQQIDLATELSRLWAERAFAQLSACGDRQYAAKWRQVIDGL